jgi:hypothetical protein
MRFFQAPHPPKLAQPWLNQYVEQIDRFALGRVALEVFFASGEEKAAASWDAYAKFAQETWETITMWSYKQVGGPKAAGDPRVSADEVWQRLLRSDIPKQAAHRVKELLGELSRRDRSVVCQLCRRMMTAEDNIRFKEVASLARAALDDPAPEPALADPMRLQRAPPLAVPNASRLGPAPRVNVRTYG